MKKENLHITKIKMRNYKSINKLNINFHPNLNILVGKNGSGKTNFLTLLFMSLWNNFENIENDFETEIEIKINDKFYQLLSKKKNKVLQPKEILRSNEIDDFYFELKIFDKNRKLIETILEINTIKEKLTDFYTTILRHGIPKKHLYLLEEPFNFSFAHKNSNEINQAMRDKKTPYFIRYLIMFFQTFYLNKYNNSVTKERIIADVYNYFNTNYRANVKHILQKFTEIKDVKLNKDIFINKIDSGYFSIKNLFFEFQINDKWLPFSNLSDGLQRIILILSEISIDEIRTAPFNKEKMQGDDEYYEIPIGKRIVLLEEPELGIHPHQLFKLMTFIKEASIKNQIIISTHSPEILDHLDNNEKNKGTKLKHLSEIEKKDAQEYMTELDLSDYWKHSDLEK